MSKEHLTEEDIENALRVVALVIDRHGDDYWPIFDRLEKELSLKRKRYRSLEKYLDRAPLPLAQIIQLPVQTRRKSPDRTDERS